MTKTTYNDTDGQKAPYKFSCFTLDNQELEITVWKYPPPTWSEAERCLVELASLKGIDADLVDLGTLRMERLDASAELERIVKSK